MRSFHRQSMTESEVSWVKYEANESFQGKNRPSSSDGGLSDSESAQAGIIPHNLELGKFDLSKKIFPVNKQHKSWISFPRPSVLNVIFALLLPSSVSKSITDGRRRICPQKVEIDKNLYD